MVQALLSRHSNFDKQTSEAQILALSDYVKNKGLKKDQVRVYKDVGSGVNPERSEMNKLLDDIRKGEISKVVVWRLDRLGRSVNHLLALLEEFKKYNVELLSLTENLDTETPSGKLLFVVLGAFAQFERDSLIERTKLGLLKARASGKKLGRPRNVKDKKKSFRRSEAMKTLWKKRKENAKTPLLASL